MKKVMAEMYQAIDGELFASPNEARLYEIGVFKDGVRVVEARVTRKVAKLYALYLMEAGGRTIEGKAHDHFGRCEIEQLLDFIYGHRRDGRPVDVKAMIEEIKV